MDQNTPQNTGSFASNLGGSQALVAAMKKRGMDQAIIDKVSASSAQGQELPMPIQGEQNVMQSIPQQAVTQVAGGQEPPTRSGEMGIALKALAQTVSTENTIAKSALKLQGI